MIYLEEVKRLIELVSDYPQIHMPLKRLMRKNADIIFEHEASSSRWNKPNADRGFEGFKLGLEVRNAEKIYCAESLYPIFYCIFYKPESIENFLNEFESFKQDYQNQISNLMVKDVLSR